MLSIWIMVKREEQRHVARGFWVEYVSPGVLRAGEEDFAVVYYEGDRWQFFYGNKSQSSGAESLSVPDESGWQALMPD